MVLIMQEAKNPRFPLAFSIICLGMKAMRLNNAKLVLIAVERGGVVDSRSCRGGNPHRAGLVPHAKELSLAMSFLV
jgi:hypothetical protein